MNLSRRRLDRAIVVALGSNLPGDRPAVQDLLEAAVARLETEGLRLRARSRWWRSAAWPDAADPPFLNGVAIVETVLDPAGTLALLRRIEAAFGRERSLVNAPRTLDLDLIAHGRRILDGPDLVLPHPRAHERAFVMAPLAEIAPDWIHPVMGLSARVLAVRAAVGADAAPLEV